MRLQFELEWKKLRASNKCNSKDKRLAFIVLVGLIWHFAP